MSTNEKPHVVDGWSITDNLLFKDGRKVAVVLPSIYVVDSTIHWTNSRAEKEWPDFCDSLSSMECLESLGYIHPLMEGK